MDKGTSKSLENIKNDWFTEISTLWPGQGMSFKVKEVLYQKQSDFQDICVVNSDAFGRVLILDGVIQATEHDEFSYQEMIAHVPLCTIEKPAKKVLVVGGGDGGVLRELARHRDLEEIHIAEIDAGVPEASKLFFPDMAIGFNDPRVTVRICDGIKFVQDCAPGSYDVIIVDSSDPVGPAEVLFEKPFFEALHRAVRPGGIVCTQAESVWLHLDIIKALTKMCSGIFGQSGGTINYAVTSIPTYPSGQIGLMLCVKGFAEEEGGEEAARAKRIEGGPLDARVVRRSEPPAFPQPLPSGRTPELKYYSSDVHRAAFVLPRFAAEALAPFLTFQGLA